MNSRKKFHWTQKNSMMVMGILYVYTTEPCGVPLLTQILVFAISLHHFRRKRRYSMIQWCIYIWQSFTHCDTNDRNSKERQNGQQTPGITFLNGSCFCCRGTEKCCNIVLQRYQNHQVKYLNYLFRECNARTFTFRCIL